MIYYTTVGHVIMFSGTQETLIRQCQRTNIPLDLQDSAIKETQSLLSILRNFNYDFNKLSYVVEKDEDRCGLLDLWTSPISLIAPVCTCKFFNVGSFTQTINLLRRQSKSIKDFRDILLKDGFIVEAQL